MAKDKRINYLKSIAEFGKNPYYILAFGIVLLLCLIIAYIGIFNSGLIISAKVSHHSGKVSHL